MPRKKGAAVKEPLQVYLTPEDRSLLDRIAHAGGLSRAEVLRRGIRRMSAELLGEEHPALKFLAEMNALPVPEGEPTDLASRFDDYLAEAYLDKHEPKKP